MTDTVYCFSISEADIDLLVAEECDCHANFRAWFLQRADIAPMGASLEFIGRSVSNYHGESDLVIVHRAGSGRRTAILVENKISAPPTELQGERYRIRGEKGIQDNQWDSFITMLIAPLKYAVSTKLVFDKVVSYEDISDVLGGDSDARAAFKKSLLNAAIQKTKVPWRRTTDAAVSEWFRCAREYAISEFPDLPLPPEARGRAPTNKWLIFFMKDFPMSRVCVEIKPHTGNVDLRFNMVVLGEMRRIFSGKIPLGADTLSAKKSCAIRLVQPRLDVSRPFDEQKIPARKIFEDAEILRKFAVAHRNEIMRMLGY